MIRHVLKRAYWSEDAEEGKNDRYLNIKLEGTSNFTSSLLGAYKEFKKYGFSGKDEHELYRLQFFLNKDQIPIQKPDRVLRRRGKKVLTNKVNMVRANFPNESYNIGYLPDYIGSFLRSMMSYCDLPSDKEFSAQLRATISFIGGNPQENTIGCWIQIPLKTRNIKMKEWAYKLGRTVYRFNVAGVTFEDRQQTIKEIKRDEFVLDFEREERNIHDRNAIKVMIGRRQIGYVPTGDAAELAPKIDKANRIAGNDLGVTLCGKGKVLHGGDSYGVLAHLEFIPDRNPYGEAFILARE